MADFVVFEDNFRAQGDIREQLEIGGHTLVAPPQDTIQGAFRLLEMMATGNVAADFMLVDGTLEDEDPATAYSSPRSFHFEHEGETEKKTVPAGLLGRKTKEIIVPRVSVFTAELNVSRRHGRAIIDIARGLNIAPPAKIIGFSGDGMSDLNVDFDIDYKNAKQIHEAVEALRGE